MEHYDWNDGWLFAPTFDPAIVRPECTGVELEPVRLPHTVKTLPYNYCNENEYQRVSGYRREFFAPKEWQGRTVLLTFGAVAHDATVFCNGRRVFHHGCGYTAFTVDLTESLLLGQKNVVAVRCDSREDLNIPPFGGQIDFLTYGGIYRAVSLDVKEPAYLRDIFIEAQAEGDFRIYSSTVGETIGCTLQAEIRSPAGSRALYSGELSLPIVGTLNGVHPWSVEHPFLYTLTVRLIRPGTSGLPDRVLDEKSTRFGFRTIQFVAGGFYLNGQRVELRGLNRHQSYAYQGYAMPDSIQQLDAQLLKKQLGCNAVRTSHYPQSPAFLDACDELGLLVFVEMPGWQHIGDEAWQAQALQNCREMVCQCRNHPSVFLWGVRVNGSSDNEAFYKRTNEAVHRLDPTRPTGGVRIARKSQLLEDVYAYNDYSYSGRGPGCEPRSAVTPDLRKGYLISEFGGQQFPAKAFDDEPHRLAQALRHAAVLNDAIAQQGVAGALGWCMADYNTHREFGSGDRICYHGVTDLFRNPKLSAAVYASQKTPRSPSDVVFEVSSSMALGDHPGGFAGACWVFTNAESVRLYRGNDFIAEFTPDRRGFVLLQLFDRIALRRLLLLFQRSGLLLCSLFFLSRCHLFDIRIHQVCQIERQRVQTLCFILIAAQKRLDTWTVTVKGNSGPIPLDIIPVRMVKRQLHMEGICRRSHVKRWSWMILMIMVIIFVIFLMHPLQPLKHFIFPHLHLKLCDLRLQLLYFFRNFTVVML